MKNILIETICGLQVLLFVYAALSKLLNHADFVTQITLYIHFAFVSKIISYVVPFAELFIALLLTVHHTKRIGIYAFIILMSVFSLYIIIMLFSDKNLPCTCGGVISSMSWKQHLIFNAGYIFIAIAGLLIYQARAKYFIMKK